MPETSKRLVLLRMIFLTRVFSRNLGEQEEDERGWRALAGNDQDIEHHCGSNQGCMYLSMYKSLPSTNQRCPFLSSLIVEFCLQCPTPCRANYTSFLASGVTLMWIGYPFDLENGGQNPLAIYWLSPDVLQIRSLTTTQLFFDPI